MKKYGTAVLHRRELEGLYNSTRNGSHCPI